jgi:hypothetical protein
LKDLIGADPEGAALANDGPGVWLWMPAGRTKYRITEDRQGNNTRSPGLPTLYPRRPGDCFEKCGYPRTKNRSGQFYTFGINPLRTIEYHEVILVLNDQLFR